MARQEIQFGLPLAFYVAVFVVVVLIIVQNKTVLGKYAAAIGGNRMDLSCIIAVALNHLLVREKAKA